MYKPSELKPLVENELITCHLEKYRNSFIQHVNINLIDTKDFF